MGFIAMEEPGAEGLRFPVDPQAEGRRQEAVQDGVDAHPVHARRRHIHRRRL